MIFKSGSPSLGKSCLIDRPPALRERLQWNDAEKRGSLSKWWASQLTRKISVLRAKTNLNSARDPELSSNCSRSVQLRFLFVNCQQFQNELFWLVDNKNARLPLVSDWLILLKAEFSHQNSSTQRLDLPRKNLWNRSGRNSHWILEVFLVQD